MLTNGALRIDPRSFDADTALINFRDRDTSCAKSSGANDPVSDALFQVDPETSSISLDILLLPGFPLHDLSCLADIFALCNDALGRRAFLRRTIGLAGGPVRAAGGIVVHPDLGIEEAQSLQNVVVLAGGVLEPRLQTRLSTALWRSFNSRSRYIAIGQGCQVLLGCRFLSAPRLAVGWELRDALREHHPDTGFVERPFHIDRQIVSCRGGDATILLALHGIGRLFGESMATTIADRLNFDHSDGRFSAVPGFASPNLRALPSVLQETIGVMRTHIEEPLTTDELSRRTGYSPREIQRRFLRYCGVSPSQYYRNHRLDRARGLLQHTCLSVIEVSLATGFRSPSHFSRLYTRRFGSRPKDERRPRTP